jgi:hypothetical protein
VGHEGKLAVPVTGMPGAWIISNQTITPSGRVFVLPDVAACNTGTQQQCNRFLATQHLRRRITYQPASRFWAFQAIAVRLPDPAKPISGGRPRSWWAPADGRHSWLGVALAEQVGTDPQEHGGVDQCYTELRPLRPQVRVVLADGH